MATSAFEGEDFICYVSLDEEINCPHNISLSFPNKAAVKFVSGGVLSETYSLGFTVENQGDAQEVPLRGMTHGTFDMKAIITSPYYCKGSELYEKEDIILITILRADEDGWYGNKAGCAKYTFGVFGTEAPGSLHYRYENFVIDIGTLEVNKIAGWNSSTQMTAKIIKPNGAIVYGSSVTLDQLGVYRIFPIEVFLAAQSDTGSIGNSTFRATVRTVNVGDASRKSSGIIYDNTVSIFVKELTAFSQNSGTTVDSNGPASISVTNADISGFSGGWVGSGSHVSECEFLFTGTTPVGFHVGKAFNASFSTVGSKYISCGGIEMASGSCTLQVHWEAP